MIIAGPNGTGKTTLLEALRWRDENGNVIHIGPHRAMRRQNVQQRQLLGEAISYRSIVMSGGAPSIEGIQILGGSEDHPNYLKHALCQIEMDRQQAITQRYDRDGEIAVGSLPDPWKPLRELTQNLLPHLRFAKIDASNRTNVQCLWQVQNSSTLVDLNDLSSGEKSIVLMFYPLIERQTRSILAGVEDSQATPMPAIAVLIDEPELHLHPNLQLKVLDYLRVLSSEEGMQVIVATHSPTIVEQASFEELFLLRPVELVEPEANQLVPVATDEEKLRLLREVFGNTSNITAMQPILVVEGTADAQSGKVVPDWKLYRAMHPGFFALTLLAGGGKGECKALVRSLNEFLPQLSNKLKAFALLDRDVEEASGNDSLKLLPVSMIENLLLDPDSIWEAIQSVAERTDLRSVTDVGAKLDAILDALEDTEVERRAIASLGIVHFRPKKPLDVIPEQASRFNTEVRERFGVEAVEKAKAEAKARVAALKQERRRREDFHGKTVLGEFFKNHLHSTPLSKLVFTYEAARYAGRRQSVATFFDELFKQISQT
ncbi:AAA family ATPase [Gloeobacter morelensis]|uniref:AAA family ATPase n=1 Tax=Gloeobacter morelensis TaxID=2907343 RepID=UPI001E323342|nr:AAA family ATPase [Gloeobacter morelensis]UFP97121.1 AAA family ATPase [Gloeobacter morelensis MG652769]